MNPITIVFAGINDHVHSRGFLSRLRDPSTAENAVWPAIKDMLESMGEVVDATKEVAFNKIVTENSVRVVSGVRMSPRRTKIRVCDCDLAVKKKILCDHISPKSHDRDREPEAT